MQSLMLVTRISHHDRTLMDVCYCFDFTSARVGTVHVPTHVAKLSSKCIACYCSYYYSKRPFRVCAHPHFDDPTLYGSGVCTCKLCIQRAYPCMQAPTSNLACEFQASIRTYLLPPHMHVNSLQLPLQYPNVIQCSKCDTYLNTNT